MKINHISNDFEDTYQLEDGDITTEVSYIRGDAYVTIGDWDTVAGEPINTVDVPLDQLAGYGFNFGDAA